MKSENTAKKNTSENRKIRKPLMEKKRRARINDSLETLKQILLETKESTGKKDGQRTAKLEKADILEMTVQYLQQLRKQIKDTKKEEKKCEKNVSFKMGVTLIPTKLDNGNIVFVMPDVKVNANVWRPW